MPYLVDIKSSEWSGAINNWAQIPCDFECDKESATSDWVDGKLEEKGVIEKSFKPVLRWKVFKDNSGTVELATSAKGPKKHQKPK